MSKWPRLGTWSQTLQPTGAAKALESWWFVPKGGQGGDLAPGAALVLDVFFHLSRGSGGQNRPNPIMLVPGWCEQSIPLLRIRKGMPMALGVSCL
jgi:hypothetical protein